MTILKEVNGADQNNNNNNNNNTSNNKNVTEASGPMAPQLDDTITVTTKTIITPTVPTTTATTTATTTPLTATAKDCVDGANTFQNIENLNYFTNLTNYDDENLDTPNCDSDDDQDKSNGSSTNDRRPVKCIFLCEFHATAGPKISAQVPENYISKDVFDTVSRYIIPKVQLQRSFLSVSLLGKKILGYPVRIDNKLYARNAFYFNFCFVFAPTTRSVVYEPVVRKLTEYMLSMELSTKILSQTNDAAQVTRLTKMLAQVRRDINQKRMCMLQEGNTIIPLCVVPQYREPPIVQPHTAAVLNSEFYRYVRTQWDLTTLRILPYINGFNHIARIAAMADVALGLVIDCIKHLVLLDVAVIVPVFQYSNVYRPTPKLSQLAKCKLLQQRCLAKCSKSHHRQAKVRDIFRMFASMAHGATFGELCVRFNPAILNINEREMVLFGLLEGLIRRVDKYPVTVSRNLFFDDGDIGSTPAKLHGTTTPTAQQTTAMFTSAFDLLPTITTAAATYATRPRHKDRISRPLPRGFQNQKFCYQTHPTFSQFGTANSYHQSPASLASSSTNSCYQKNSNNNSIPTTSQKTPQYLYNGLKSFDEICTMRGISCQQLEMQLSRDRHAIVLLK